MRCMRGLVLVLVVLVPAWRGWSASPARFAARLADGTLVEGRELTEWFKPDAAPKLNNQALLDAARPLVWLRDRSLTPAEPPVAFVELFSGDRLPGTVSGYQREDPAALDQEFAHWIVEPTARLRPPRRVERPEIRVLAKYVRRVVWQRRRLDRYQPGTLFTRDGKAFSFRTARIGDGYLTLLLADGPRRVSFAESAELHLPVGENFDPYWDELAVLAPDGQTRLIQVETDDGLVATASQRYFTAYAIDGAKTSDGWVHGLQPAWSADLLWVPLERTLLRRMFAPHELLLSRVPPAPRPASAGPTSPWPWQLNRNVQGGLLRSGGQDYGWGFGVHAFSELRFALPPLARTFRTGVALDYTAGTGGCVQARIFCGPTSGPPLFQTPILVGAQNVVPSGNLVLPPADGKPRELVLQVDPAHANRPPGADPLDIRDMTDWLDPVVELDAERLREELRRRLPYQIAAWKDWTVTAAAPGSCTLQLQEPAGRPGNFLRSIGITKDPLLLTRQLPLGRDDRWLLLAASQDKTRERGPVVQVRIDGEIALEQPVPFRENARAVVNPLVLSLADYRRTAGAEVRIEIRQTAAADEVPVAWRGIAVAAELPMLRPLFEDTGRFTSVGPDEAAPAAPATLVEDERHSGRAAVKLPAGRRYRLVLPDKLAIREQPAWGEYRFLRFAWRKSGAGRACLELEHPDSALRPARYDAGQGEPSYGKAQRVWDKPLPDSWIVETRDLTADFGPLDVTALVLSAPDGEAVLFDHLYLARTRDDFQYLPGGPSPEATNQQAREALAKPVLEQVLPACVAIDFGGGRVGTGTLLSAAGDVLAAGHLVLGPDKPVTLQLADGRSLAGRTRGVCRDLDLGLVQITTPGPYPFVELETTPDVDAGKLYVGITHKRPLAAGQGPATAVVGIRRLLPDSLWTDFDLADAAGGGPLLNAAAKLVAVHTRRSSFGGFLYSRLAPLPALLPRLKNGEVWGAWQLGTGPLVGVVITTTAEGCKVIEVMPDQSAGRVGIQVGDYFRKVNGRPVLMLDDVYQALADKDPGQEVDVEYTRGAETRQARLQLSPRG